jgi:hypothetical protein
MSKYTIHNQYGDFMYDTTKTLNSAILKCKNLKRIIYETYFAPSPFNRNKITEHGKEVFRTF